MLPLIARLPHFIARLSWAVFLAGCLLVGCVVFPQGAQAAGIVAVGEQAQDAFAVEWADYQAVDSKTTAKSIKLRGTAFTQVKPRGYVIYRKASGSTFKKIADVRKRARSFSYTDRKVKASAKYVYRFRAYRIEGGKRVYSTWSSKVVMRAVNWRGRYQAEFLTTPGSETDVVEMKLTSKAGNGTLVLQERGRGAGEMYYHDDGAYADLELAATSKDGRTWAASGKREVSLKAGRSLYVRYRIADPDGTGELAPFVFVPDPGKDSWLTYEDAVYAGKHAVFSLDCLTGGAIAYYNGEYYH